MSKSSSQVKQNSRPTSSAGSKDTAIETANSRLLNRFYEPLLLLRTLNADRGPGEVDLPSAPQSRGFKLIWRRFLDDLSWLCDNRHGGETVSAVAAQDLPEGIQFWRCSKHEASFPHFEWVLTSLQNAQSQSAWERATLASNIAVKSIAFSEDKINNYRHFLKWALRRAKEIVAASETLTNPELAEYEDFFTEVDALLSIRKDPLGTCRAANRFRHRSLLVRLMRTDSSLITHSPWSALWHFIGRLGCWFGKCTNLVQTVRRYPQLLEGSTCQFLALPEEIGLPVDRSRGDLQSALKRMLPAQQQSVVPELYEQLVGLRLFDIPEAFSGNFTDESLTGRVHAEVYLLEQFYFNNFRFWGREKYIGCSKPSCYCCSLYLRFHPANPVLRPAHNNVYLTWLPPLIDRLREEPERKHNLNILNQMNAYIRRDVMEEIEERIPRRERAPDSTSGVALGSYISR